MHLSADIDATPEEVFDLYVDPARRSEWNPAARSVTLVAGTIDQPGSRYVVDTRYGQMHVEVIKVDRPRLYRLRERSGMMESEATMRFEPLPAGGCRLVVEARFERAGLAGRLLAPLFSATGRWWARGELRRLKDVAERYSANR